MSYCLFRSVCLKAKSGIRHLSSNVGNSRCQNLRDRTVIDVSGKDSYNFLQALITNDIRHLEETKITGVQLDCIYSLMLNVQGRVMFDLFLYKNAQVANSILLECDADLQDELVKHLNKYKIRRKIDIKLTEKQVWWLAGEGAISKNTSEGIIVCDPRTIDIGFRAALEKSDANLLTNVVENEYREHIYKLGVGEGKINYSTGQNFPLECNGDYLNGVSFQKGCYIGQELTSRVHHTGVVRKRILPITLENANPKKEEELIIKNEAGKNVGKVKGASGKHGIALMRLEETFNAKELWCGDERVQAFKPNWWPLKGESSS